nr:ATP-dependent 6-phosphofructokinase 6-like [Tanacetum cinerariifolium]
MAEDPKPLTNDSKARHLKEFIIKFTIKNGQIPLTLDYKTFKASTGLDYNKGDYIAHPSPEVVKAELVKISTNEALSPQVKLLILKIQKETYNLLLRDCLPHSMRALVAQSLCLRVNRLMPKTRGNKQPTGMGSSSTHPDDASYANLRAVVKGFAVEADNNRNNYDTAINNVMENVDQINAARIEEQKTLLKALNRVSETLKADSALKVSMQKMSDTNTTTSSNITDLIELLRNVSMQAVISSIKGMVTEIFHAFKGFSSSTPSGSATIPTVTKLEVNVVMGGGRIQRNRPTTKPTLEVKLIESLSQPTSPVITPPEQSIHEEQPKIQHTTPKADRGKGIARDTDESPRKLVKAPTKVHLILDTPLLFPFKINGDLLASFLFLIADGRLNMVVNEAVKEGYFKGVEVESTAWWVRVIKSVYGEDGGVDGEGHLVRRCGLKAVVAGISKTVDNDILVIDKSFGFDTAVEEAQRVINAAHVEAKILITKKCISKDVDLCLISKLPFYLEREGGLLEYVERRLKDNGHMVIIVAEGAGQELLAAKTLKTSTTQDASGNKLQGVGLSMVDRLLFHSIASVRSRTMLCN